MPHTTSPGYSRTRRQFLGTATAGAAAAILAACGGEAATVAPPAPTAPPRPTTAGATVAPTTATTAAAVTAPTTAPSGMTTAAPAAMPTAVPMAVAAPAIEGVIPSGVNGVPDAYPKVPMPYKTVNMIPGKGGTVTHFAVLFNAPPPPRGENAYWQDLEKRLGVKWEVTFTPSASYGEKVSATLAGGDLPDLFYLNSGFNGAGSLLRTIQQGAFTDLTSELTGDNLKQYPNLARLPSYVWDTVRINKKIYGVPKPILRVNNIPFYRGDWAKKLGIAKPTNTDQVHDMLVAFSKRDPDGDGQANTYGMAAATGGWNLSGIYRPMFRVPNDWILRPDGTLAYYIETPEFRQCLEFVRRVHASGGFHPDAGTFTNTQNADAFKAGKTGMHTEGYINFWGDRMTRTGEIRYPVEGAEVVPLVPPGFDGGKGATGNGSGVYGFTGIPTRVGRDTGRVKELLRLADYMSAPFGSEEWVAVNQGIEGVHFTRFPDNSYNATDKGRAERNGIAYAFTSEHRFFFSNGPGEAEKAQATAKEAQAIAVDNPILGLYSPTNDMKAAELNQLNIDRIAPIVTSKEPVAALDTYIRDWRSRGGDTIRKEYEQAIRDNK